MGDPRQEMGQPGDREMQERNRGGFYGRRGRGMHPQGLAHRGRGMHPPGHEGMRGRGMPQGVMGRGMPYNMRGRGQHPLNHPYGDQMHGQHNP